MAKHCGSGGDGSVGIARTNVLQHVPNITAYIGLAAWGSKKMFFLVVGPLRGWEVKAGPLRKYYFSV